MIKVILNDEVIFSLAKLVDDSQFKTREPSHPQIEVFIKRHRLNEGDLSYNGQVAGKTKRVRSVLNWAYENNQLEGEKFALGLIHLVRSVGGFRSSSPNYIGNEY
ncbi:MAG: hypothetical protein ABS948_06590 [Solibacillus sp.]